MLKKSLIVLIPLVLFFAVIKIVIPYFDKMRYDFTLQGAEGNVSLSDFRGKTVALYFGYTYCPDICPTTFSTLTQAIKKLDPQEASQVQIVFISVDPKRDSPKHLKEYVEYFHPSIVGITGSKAQIDAVVRNYEGSAYSFIQKGSDAMGYTVAHTSYVYFFDNQGNLSSRLSHSMDNDEALKHFKKALGN